MSLYPVVLHLRFITLQCVPRRLRQMLKDTSPALSQNAPSNPTVAKKNYAGSLFSSASEGVGVMRLHILGSRIRAPISGRICPKSLGLQLKILILGENAARVDFTTTLPQEFAQSHDAAPQNLKSARPGVAGLCGYQRDYITQQ